MANFNFNGITDPILPSVYINKITLDGAEAALNKIAANKNSVIDAHIAEENVAGYVAKEGDYSAPKLIVTYDLLLEVEDIYDDIIESSFVSDIFKHINLHVVTLKGTRGKQAYRHLLKTDTGKFSEKLTISRLIHGASGFLGLKNTGMWPTIGTDTKLSASSFKYSKKTLDNIIENQHIPANEDNLAPSLQYRRDFIKQKYQHIMPDGRTIYKIPVKVKQEISGHSFPNDLAAIVVCSLDTTSMLEDYEGFDSLDPNVVDHDPYEASWGRVATEVILKNGAPPKQGMIFFISTDQGNNTEFDHIKGTLWMGGVHKHKDRFMAGNEHDPETNHPYLDYVMVENSRVHDFRQLAVIKKQILNFESQKNKFAGQKYINNQLHKIVTADFSEPACFSNLISTINGNRLVKLAFSIDWGKLLKKHCIMPSVLDRLATENPGLLKTFFESYAFPNILSFKIYRERIDTTHDIINDTGKKIIYDGFPNIYYTGNTQKGLDNPDKKFSDPEILSALVPLKVFYPTPGIENTSFLGHMTNFTFTDYDIERTSRGQFRYSIEAEMVDPTLNYIVDVFNTINSAVQALKPFVSFVNGDFNTTTSSKTPLEIFDPTKGAFTEAAIAIMNNEYYLEKLYKVPGNPVVKALSAMSVFVFFEEKGDFQPGLPSLRALIDIENGATPDSINVFNDILVTMLNKLRSIIESHSTTKIPKIESFGEGGIKERALSSTPVVATIPQKKIQIKHTFKSVDELVNTFQSEAGYDFFGGTSIVDSDGKSQGGIDKETMGISNKTSLSIGLKSIDFVHLNQRASKEARFYWPLGADPASNVSLPLPDELGTMEMAHLSLYATTGRYFTVPIGGTYLPKYVVNHSSGDEQSYHMVVNNILRFKSGLYGDYNEKHKLGYGPADKIAGSLGITEQMERILKEYQTLASIGVYFPQDSIVEGLGAHQTISSNDSDKWLGMNSFPWDGINNPLGDNLDMIPLETKKNMEDSSELQNKMRVPWAENWDMEQLLMSLIVGTLITPTVLDLKLGAFDPLLKGSKFNKFIRDFYNQHGPGNTATWLQYNLPHQLLALIANLNWQSRYHLDAHVQNTPMKKGNFIYYEDGGKPQLYEVPKSSPDPFKSGEKLILPEDVQDQDMKIDKFGQFWFNHMNIAEVQYLHGYERTTVPTGKKITQYEEIYSSALNSPIWYPLDQANLSKMIYSMDQENAAAQWHIMCRLVKKKFPFFNPKAYEVLDLPIMDEYFLITTKKQMGTATQGPYYNAYIHGLPTSQKGADDSTLQMIMDTDKLWSFYSEAVELNIEVGDVGE